MSTRECTCATNRGGAETRREIGHLAPRLSVSAFRGPADHSPGAYRRSAHAKAADRIRKPLIASMPEEYEPV